MCAEQVCLEFTTVAGMPQLQRYTLALDDERFEVTPGGTRPLPVGSRGTKILVLLLVRLARWRGVPAGHRPEVIPLLEGLAKTQALDLPSDAVAFGVCLHQVKKTQWLRDMLAFGLDPEAEETKARLGRWFHLQNATGRSKSDELARIGIYPAALPPEAVLVCLDGEELSGLALDALERRLAGQEPLRGSWPPLLNANAVRVLGSLPSVAPSVREREADLAQINQRYDAGQCRLMVLVGGAGEGKTTVACEWLRARVGAGSLRQRLVFTWSFYQQGYRGQTGQLLTEFWGQLSAALGVVLHDRMLDTEKAALLWQAMLAMPTLLWLDGLEVMLREHCRQAGGIHDAALAALIELVVNHSEPHESFVFCASREHLTGPLRSAHPEVQHVILARVLPPVPTLGALPSQASHSALELSLGAWALAEADAADGSKLLGLVRAKLAALPDDAQRAITLAACLFDRPPEWEHVHWLLTSTPPLPGLHVPGETMPEDAWSEAVDQLMLTGLLRVTAASALELHPLVIECLAADFRHSSPKLWAAAQARLRDHFAAIPTSDTPDTLTEMEPLFRAVWHGCKAGECQRTYETICIPRVSRGTSGYVITGLNAHSAALTLLEQFCPDHLTFPAGSDLSDEGRIFSLFGIGYCFSDLDRLEESYQAIKAAWARIKPAHRVDWVGPTSTILLRMQYTFGSVDQSMPVMKRLLKALMSAPISGQSFGVPPNSVSLALGWTATVCCRTLWALGHRRRARFFLWLLCSKTRSVIGQPQMILLPSLPRAWHALLLLEMGEWQTCAKAEAAGELDDLDIRSRATGMDDWVRGRIRSEQARQMKPGQPRDTLCQEALRYLESALSKVQGRYRWLEASMNLDIARHHLAFGDQTRGELHRTACQAMAEEHGFKLLRQQALA